VGDTLVRARRWPLGVRDAARRQRRRGSCPGSSSRRPGCPWGCASPRQDLAQDLARWGAPVSVVVPGPARLRAPVSCASSFSARPRLPWRATDAPRGGRSARRNTTIQEERCGRRAASRARGRVAAGRPVGGLRLPAPPRRALLSPGGDLLPRAPEPGPPSRCTWREGPAFRDRSMHAHGDHPIDLSAPRDSSRACPWPTTSAAGSTGNVKPPSNVGRRRFSTRRSSAATRTSAGFPRRRGAQSGQRAAGRAPGPRARRRRASEGRARIAAAIDRLLAPVAGSPDASMLTVLFSPSEFTQSDEDQTVARLELVARYMREHHPGGEAVHDQPWHAPRAAAQNTVVRFLRSAAIRRRPEMGVLVHPLMLYEPAAGRRRGSTATPILPILQRLGRGPAGDAPDRLLPGVVLVADVRSGGAAVPGARDARGRVNGTWAGWRRTWRAVDGARNRRRGSSPVHERGKSGATG